MSSYAMTFNVGQRVYMRQTGLRAYEWSDMPEVSASFRQMNAGEEGVITEVLSGHQGYRVEWDHGGSGNYNTSLTTEPGDIALPLLLS